jgi:hypothetical protein
MEAFSTDGVETVRLEAPSVEPVRIRSGFLHSAFHTRHFITYVLPAGEPATKDPHMVSAAQQNVSRL